MSEAEHFYKIWLKLGYGRENEYDIRLAVLDASDKPEWNCKKEVNKLINLKLKNRHGKNSKDYQNNIQERVEQPEGGISILS